MEPIYAEKIIVGIKTKEKFNWYITDKDDWILDLYKYQRAYEEKGFLIDIDFMLQFRYGVGVLDTDTIDSVLHDYYLNQKVESSQLKDLILKKTYNKTILDLSPSLYIDFVAKQLFSMYPEPIPFERYVPDGWVGKREDFTEYLTEKDRYWIENGKNLIREQYESELRME